MARTLKAGLAALETNHHAMAKLERESERILDEIRPMLIGRVVDGHRLGNQSGDYQINGVSLRYDLTVQATGLKVRANGRLGEQAWEIGRITARRLKL